LNFASAKSAGGGFLTGAQAQEESLARASGLYPCISEQKSFYKANKRHHSNLYLDDMIYTPKVPVFRDDEGELLSPYPLSIVTSPAANAGVVKAQESHHIHLIGSTMQGRIDKLLALCAHHQHHTLILGAWGCGVFKNNPQDIASYFAATFGEGGLFHRAFKRVVFAILDHTKDQSIISAFRERIES